MLTVENFKAELLEAVKNCKDVLICTVLRCEEIYKTRPSLQNFTNLKDNKQSLTDLECFEFALETNQLFTKDMQVSLNHCKDAPLLLSELKERLIFEMNGKPMLMISLI